VPLCALGYPIFDMLLAVARRTLRGQPVWTSDRDHIHHRLLARGHSPSQAAAIIYAVSVLLVIGGVLAMSANHLAVGLAIVAVLGLAIFSVRVLGYIEWGGWRERDETKILHAAGTLAGLKLRTAASAEDVLAGFAIVGAEAGFSVIRLVDGAAVVEWKNPRLDGNPALRAAEHSQLEL